MIGAVLKLIVFTSMVNRIINTSRNERVTQQVCDTNVRCKSECKEYVELNMKFKNINALLK